MTDAHVGSMCGAIAAAKLACSSATFFFDIRPARSGVHSNVRSEKEEQCRCQRVRGVSSPGFLAAYFLAMQVSRRAHPFLLRSVQCFPARTSSQYRHLERGLFFFGEFFRRRAQ